VTIPALVGKSLNKLSRGGGPSMKALIIGIDDYEKLDRLACCSDDAKAIAEILKYHHDKRVNFDDCELITSGTGDTGLQNISAKIYNFFQGRSDFALFYFSGHGTTTEVDGHLATSDSYGYSAGFSMRSLLQLAHSAKGIAEILLIVDCCHSGSLGQAAFFGADTTVLREGISILTASRPAQKAYETGKRGGAFTRLIVEALAGGAADVQGKVTVASIYAYVDQSMRERDQRPMFKSHVSRFFPVRWCEPGVPPEVLRVLPRYFKTEDATHGMDPSYEHSRLPEHAHIPKSRDKEEIFRHFQVLRNARLLIANASPPDLYFAAIKGGSARLTSLGKYYWKLAKDGSI
jgi:hypothetical protein